MDRQGNMHGGCVLCKQYPPCMLLCHSNPACMQAQSKLGMHAELRKTGLCAAMSAAHLSSTRRPLHSGMLSMASRMCSGEMKFTPAFLHSCRV